MKDAILTIKGLTGVDESGEEIELVTDGQYSFEDKKAAIEYMESELTGMRGTRTAFSVGPEGVMITRSGTVNMHMLFQQGRKNYFNYITPYGSMTMGVDTQSIRNELNERGGRLEVKYVMDLGCSVVSRRKLEIDIRA